MYICMKISTPEREMCFMFSVTENNVTEHKLMSLGTSHSDINMGSRFSRREINNVLQVSGDEQFRALVLMLKIMEASSRAHMTDILNGVHSLLRMSGGHVGELLRTESSEKMVAPPSEKRRNSFLNVHGLTPSAITGEETMGCDGGGAGVGNAVIMAKLEDIALQLREQRETLARHFARIRPLQEQNLTPQPVPRSPNVQAPYADGSPAAIPALAKAGGGVRTNCLQGKQNSPDSLRAASAGGSTPSTPKFVEQHSPLAADQRLNETEGNWEGETGRETGVFLLQTQVPEPNVVSVAARLLPAQDSAADLVYLASSTPIDARGSRKSQHAPPSARVGRRDSSGGRPLQSRVSMDDEPQDVKAIVPGEEPLLRPGANLKLSRRSRSLQSPTRKASPGTETSPAMQAGSALKPQKLERVAGLLKKIARDEGEEIRGDEVVGERPLSMPQRWSERSVGRSGDDTTLIERGPTAAAPSSASSSFLRCDWCVVTCVWWGGAGYLCARASGGKREMLQREMLQGRETHASVSIRQLQEGRGKL